MPETEVREEGLYKSLLWLLLGIAYFNFHIPVSVQLSHINWRSVNTTVFWYLLPTILGLLKDNTVKHNEERSLGLPNTSKRSGVV